MNAACEEPEMQVVPRTPSRNAVRADAHSSFLAQILCPEPFVQAPVPLAQPFHPSNALIGPALQLLSLQNAAIKLDGLVLEEVFESGDALLQRVVRSYTMQASCVREW